MQTLIIIVITALYKKIPDLQMEVLIIRIVIIVIMEII